MMNCPILMYHYIGDPADPEDAPYWVSTQEFERQMAFLRNRGFHGISLQQLCDHLFHGASIPRRSIITDCIDQAEFMTREQIRIMLDESNIKNYYWPS